MIKLSGFSRTGTSRRRGETSDAIEPKACTSLVHLCQEKEAVLLLNRQLLIEQLKQEITMHGRRWD